MTKLRLRDVQWLTVTLAPITVCEPPEGQKCYLSHGRPGMSPAEAKRHALDHPGHYVVRDAITRSQYILELPEEQS